MNDDDITGIKTTGHYFVSTMLSTAILFAWMGISGACSLCDPAEKGNLAEVTKLIAEGADVNTKASWGWTALHEACDKGHSDIARALIDSGLDAKHPGATALHN